MNDSEFQDNPAEAAATPAVSDWPSPGQKLKKHREELGLSHNRVADALHMTAHYVKALETDQYDKLPGKTFVKGYFRAYAKLLDVDVEEVMTCYERYVSALEESEETEAKVIRAKKAYDQNMRWMICAALIIVMVIGVSWWYSSHKSSSATMAASPPANVARAETAASPVAPRVTAQSQAEQANASMTLIATLDQADLVERAATAPEGDSEDSLDAAGVVAASAAQAAGTDLAVAMTENDLEAPVSAPDAIEASPVTVAADAMAEDVTTPGLTPAGLPDDTIVELADSRQVNLESEGNDLLQVHFSGASWIEVDNGENTRLYNDMLSNGDDLTIRGMAPFNVLVGDANMVDITFNSRAVDLTSRMRTDHSARIILEPETN